MNMQKIHSGVLFITTKNLGAIAVHEVCKERERERERRHLMNYIKKKNKIK